MHPFYGGGRGKVTRIRFHDQRIGIPIFEPIDQSTLITEIKGTSEDMDILSEIVIGNLQLVGGCDSFPATRQASEQTHSTITCGGEQIKKWRSVVGQYALLNGESSSEMDHWIRSHLEKMTAVSSRYCSHHWSDAST